MIYTVTYEYLNVIVGETDYADWFMLSDDVEQYMKKAGPDARVSIEQK